MGLAIVAGLIAVFMVQRHVSNLRGETMIIFKASADQVAGKTLGSSVEEVSIPSGLFPALLTEAPTAEMADFVQTTALRADISAGDVILYRHFESALDRGVRPEIPPGMKAISIPVSEVSSVAFFIQPEDLVDVLGTFVGDTEASGPQANAEMYEVSTRPIVQAVRVLAVGNQHRVSDRQTSEPYSSITLLVSMEEAAKLVFARDYFGVKLTLILRGEDDMAVETVLPSVGVETRDFNQIGNTPMPAGNQ